MKTIILKIKLLFLLTFTLFSIETFAQPTFREIKIINEIPATPVKDQANTGTCWSFGTTSFIESELIRLGKGEFDLSEMFTIRCTYEDHARMFVRYHGNINFGAGAEGWDLFNVVKNYGIVPQEAYPGLIVNPQMHDHVEMDQVLKSMMAVLIKKDKLTTVWNKAISAVLDVYLGEYPQEFEYKGKKYSPKSFRDYLGIDVSNYIAFTSFTNNPYYTEIVFESPDNWSNGAVKNVKLDDLTEIINHALLNGYSVIWASDVSDPGFNHKKGLAIVPEKDWADMNEDEKTQTFIKPVKQKEITPELRQIGYDNYETTDDHLMHIVGLAKDKNGTKYYKVKNSWGIDSNEFGGCFYASESYVKLKTMTVAVHKDAIPKAILEKLNE